ncbi:MAG: xanthine dehydrogenase family protein subunit M [Oscillospiraceae bacterium]
MIPFDFEYYRPDSIKEAVDVFYTLKNDGKSPVYYGGGSELISMARVGNASFDAVVDIKNVPECRAMGAENGKLILGSALTLSDISESRLFPLMEKTGGRIADHTMQCKITLGGNLASSIIYRETVLPLLLSDAKLTVANRDGIREYNMSQTFRERLLLQSGDLLVRAAVAMEYTTAPFIHVKKTKNEKIDYPLITAAALKKDGFIRIAFSGLASFPFRDCGLENILNDGSLSFRERALKIGESLNGIYLNDLSGSSEYRKFVLMNTLENILETMKDR